MRVLSMLLMLFIGCMPAMPMAIGMEDVGWTLEAGWMLAVDVIWECSVGLCIWGTSLETSWSSLRSSFTLISLFFF